MAIKYWEFEDAPLKEKLKNPNIRDLAKIYFDNDTRAFRFAKALLEVKKKGQLRLRDCSKDLPVATWKRYLDFGVQVGMLKHEDNAYSFTDRYSKPFRNVASYIKAWIETQGDEDLEVLFANANMDRQEKRGGRTGETADDSDESEEVKTSANAKSDSNSAEPVKEEKQS